MIRKTEYSMEMTPAKFFGVARTMLQVAENEKLLAELQEFERELNDESAKLDADRQGLAKSCAALVADVHQALRRRRPTDDMESHFQDDEDYGDVVRSSHFLAVVSESVDLLVSSYDMTRSMIQSLRPGLLMLSSKGQETATSMSFSDFTHVQQLVAEMSFNQPTISRFLTGITSLDVAMGGLQSVARSIEATCAGYHRHLLDRHSTKGVPTFDHPILTDLAITIYKNIDSHGEIESGKNADEVSAYTLRKAITVAESLQNPLLRSFIDNIDAFAEFITQSLSSLGETIESVRDLFTQTSGDIFRILQARKSPRVEMGDIQRCIDLIKYNNPRSIVGRERAVMLSREEKFNNDFRDETIRSMTQMMKGWGSTSEELTNFVLRRKAELRKYFQDENSFYVCQIGSGNSFGGVAPGALQVIPGPRPLANLDDIIGSGFDQVKQFIHQVERTAEWADIFMATSPSRSTDKSNVLLVGPQGCGKSEALRAVGSDTKSISIFAQGSDFLTCWMGEAQKNPKRLFEAGLKLQKEARKHVHFLIDEIDSVLNNDKTYGTSLNLSLEFQILMDGVVQYPNLSVWGATNNPGRIPMPMIRRFSKVLIVGELDTSQRIRLLQHYIRSFLPTLGIQPTHWEAFAEALTGATGDVIRKVCDHVWRTVMTEFVEKKPDVAKKLKDSLSQGNMRFDVSVFDSNKRARFLDQLEDHVAVTKEMIDESIKLHLSNIAINQEIRTAVETYRNAHEFLAQLRS